MKDILVLGIESSCDETSVSVVKNGREILSNIIDTQIPIHEKYGGVVPEIASRNHIEAISRVMKKALETANVTLNDIDVITPTYGPGLVGALLVGVSYAKGLAFSCNKPLVGVNHIQGHIAANYITHKELKEKILRVIKGMENGESFVDCILKEKVFNGSHASMLTIGIKSGRQEEVLKKLVDLYQKDIIESTSHFLNIIEPTIVAILSLIVGIILLSIMLPLMGIMSSI